MLIYKGEKTRGSSLDNQPPCSEQSSDELAVTPGVCNVAL